MFDFRYHALSLVAVFVALALGILLGVAIGDAGLVSSARRDVVKGLRGDLQSARGDADDLRATLRRRDDFEDQIFGDLVAGRLTGRSIGVILLGEGSDRTVNLVRQALEPAGARLRFVAVVREPPDLGALADRAGATRYAGLGSDDGLERPFAERVGQQLMVGGKLVAQVRQALASSFSGDLGQLDAAVVVRPPGRDAERRSKPLEEGLVRGMHETDRPVVGVELSDDDPSQVSWYRDRNIASVDSIDLVSGRAALVFALAGADGAYGVKGTAEALLPRVVGGVRRP